MTNFISQFWINTIISKYKNSVSRYITNLKYFFKLDCYFVCLKFKSLKKQLKKFFFNKNIF